MISDNLQSPGKFGRRLYERLGELMDLEELDQFERSELMARVVLACQERRWFAIIRRGKMIYVVDKSGGDVG